MQINECVPQMVIKTLILKYREKYTNMRDFFLIKANTYYVDVKDYFIFLQVRKM